MGLFGDKEPVIKDKKQGKTIVAVGKKVNNETRTIANAGWFSDSSKKSIKKSSWF